VRVLDDLCTPFPGFYLYDPSRTDVAPKLQALVGFLKLPAGKEPARARSGASSASSP
jgi:hypothetical protein